MVAESTTNAVIITDAQRWITWVNEGFTRITRYSSEEVIGKLPGALLQCDQTDPATVAKIREALDKGEGCQTEILNRGKTGQLYWMAMDIQPIRDSSGILTEFIAIQSDITAQKRAQALMVENKLRLEESERALKASLAQAESATRAKSEFLANMSHEIRTPMTAILGFADLLVEDGATPNAPKVLREYIATIKRHGEHLLSVINDILDIAKIEAGKMDVECIPTAVVPMVESVMSLMRVRTQSKNITLRARYDGLVPRYIRSDPILLRQILLNLVGNAVKFTEAGEVALTIDVDQTGGPVGAGGALLRIAVSDTGIGMTNEQMGRLFEAFEQADTSVRRRFGGTGLGLQISKRLAGLLGGDITVVSQPGTGSVFSVTVSAGPLEGVEMVDPLAELAAMKADELVNPESEHAVHDPGAVKALEGVRVLLVEDGPDNQRLIAFHPRRVGAIVLLADNGLLGLREMCVDGNEAGELLSPAPVEVILMDMQMPEMDGYTAAATLRSKGCRLPIIALTAHAMSGDRDRCLAAGCTSYATKPIDKTLLIQGVVASIGTLKQAAGGIH